MLPAVGAEAVSTAVCPDEIVTLFEDTMASSGKGFTVTSTAVREGLIHVPFTASR
ncbi:hypothetical protein PBAL39_04343 [Pedobacter sp. BAL39]|nr:hypothetical protein PBAL39_04343 [Pedobacter sp. BAL39]